MVSKRIICLANSYMNNGRCIAGIESKQDGQPGDWIRPINRNHPFSGLAVNEILYESGDEPKILDVIDIDFTKHQPTKHQTENWTLASGRFWKKVSEAKVSDLSCDVVQSKIFWNENFRHTREGSGNDRIHHEDVTKFLTHSLCLIHAEKLTLEPNSYDPNKLRGCFQHANLVYNLAVTDLIIRAKYGQATRSSGEIELSNCLLTISLAQESYKKNFYKLLVGVIEL